MPNSYEALGSNEEHNQEEEKDPEDFKKDGEGLETSTSHESADKRLYNEVLMLVNIVLPGEGTRSRLSNVVQGQTAE